MPCHSIPSSWPTPEIAAIQALRRLRIACMRQLPKDVIPVACWASEAPPPAAPPATASMWNGCALGCVACSPPSRTTLRRLRIPEQACLCRNKSVVCHNDGVHAMQSCLTLYEPVKHNVAVSFVYIKRHAWFWPGHCRQAYHRMLWLPDKHAGRTPSAGHPRWGAPPGAPPAHPLRRCSARTPGRACQSRPARHSQAPQHQQQPMQRGASRTAHSRAPRWPTSCRCQAAPDVVTSSFSMTGTLRTLSNDTASGA